jgi:hypothetical protein
MEKDRQNHTPLLAHETPVFTSFAVIAARGEITDTICFY